MSRLLLAVCLLAVGLGAAHAERRVALVVGNSAYTAVPALTNPANDAADVSAKLTALGFAVVTGLDLTVSQFDQAVRDFNDKLDGADVALFYYSGHGVQAAGQNYLLPVDAGFSDVAGMKRQTVALQDVMEDMQARAKTALVFVDACRDNPLNEKLRVATRSTSATRGLARVDVAANNTLVVFATAPGKVAADGDGRNSPFTSAFLGNIGAPGVEIESVMKRVTAAVLAGTKGEQEPERLSRLTSEFYFVPAGAPAPTVETPAPQPPDPGAEAARAFEAAKAMGTADALDAFIAAYPGTFYARLAGQLKAKAAAQQAAVAPPVAAAPPPAPSAAPEPVSQAAPSLPPPAGASICKWFQGGNLSSEAYCASTVLAPQAGNSYGPDRLRSAGPGDAWCEGRPDDGLGETIVFRMDPAQSFASVTIANGYTKSATTFSRNNRPHLVELRTGDGLAAEVELDDTARPQRLTLPRPARTGWVSLTIRSVYPGSKYTDTCVSYFRPDIGQ